MSASGDIGCGLLLLAGLPLLFWFLGARLTAGLDLDQPGERLAYALLAGLLVAVFLMSWVSALLPLSRPSLALVLAPAALTLIRPKLVTQAASDLARCLRQAPAVLASAAFLLLLLWPLVAEPGLLYYDGTANHDGFFWVTGAEYLMQSGYLRPAEIDPLHPYLNGVRALTGWTPGFGRMGAEAYIALSAILTGRLPVETYLWASAALYFAWLAAVYGICRQFITGSLSRMASVGLAGFQPLFVFFHLNANLPNLLGALSGAAFLLGLARGLDSIEKQGRAGWAWLAYTALAAHALLACYPEMFPFVALPAGLLLFRSCRRRAERTHGLVSFAGWLALAAVACNPATTLRAVSGFITAFGAARSDQTWASIVSGVDAPGFLTTLLTLSPKAGHEIGMLGGALFTAGLTAAIILAVVFAKDRAGVLILFTGGAALAIYTFATGFSYGWQKTVQFSAVFIAAVISVGAFQACGQVSLRPAIRHLAAGLLAAFFLYAGVIIQMDHLKWSGRKHLGRDWLELRSLTLEGPLLVAPATFEQPFFHGMWAPYFLPRTAIVFPDDGAQHAGYLVNTVQIERELSSAPAASLVGAAWAARRGSGATPIRSGMSFRVLPGRVQP